MSHFSSSGNLIHRLMYHLGLRTDQNRCRYFQHRYLSRSCKEETLSTGFHLKNKFSDWMLLSLISDLPAGYILSEYFSFSDKQHSEGTLFAVPPGALNPTCL